MSKATKPAVIIDVPKEPEAQTECWTLVNVHGIARTGTDLETKERLLSYGWK